MSPGSATPVAILATSRALASFTLFFFGVQHGISYGGSDEEAADDHGSHGNGKLAPLVQHFTRVVASWMLPRLLLLLLLGS